MVVSYQLGRRCIPVSMLQPLAQALSVHIDEPLGEQHKTCCKRGPAPPQGLRLFGEKSAVLNLKLW
jgi:hypothetical protein